MIRLAKERPDVRTGNFPDGLLAPRRASGRGVLARQIFPMAGKVVRAGAFRPVNPEHTSEDKRHNIATEAGFPASAAK